MAKNDHCTVEVANEEFAQIRRLLGTGTAELEHSNLNHAHEALLAARRIFEQLAAQIAHWSREQQVFALQLAQTEQAIARSERRLVAHVANKLDTGPTSVCAK